MLLEYDDMIRVERELRNAADRLEITFDQLVEVAKNIKAFRDYQDRKEASQ